MIPKSSRQNKSYQILYPLLLRGMTALALVLPGCEDTESNMPTTSSDIE